TTLSSTWQGVWPRRSRTSALFMQDRTVETVKITKKKRIEVVWVSPVGCRAVAAGSVSVVHAAQEDRGRHRSGPGPPYGGHDLLVGGDHHDRSPGGFGLHQANDQLVGGPPRFAEQQTHPAGLRRSRRGVHVGTVEHTGDLGPGTTGQPFQGGQQAGTRID